MRVSDILRRKGVDVVTIKPDVDVRRFVALLAEHRIGAIVISSDGRSIDGIVSERDIVIALADRGAAVLSEPVSAICTSDVHTVEPDAQTEELMSIMTEKRIRHVPVVKDGALHGIISIGDVVKSRMNELETERTALSAYISTAN
jgi:CBS domain-containing protein